MALEKLKIKKVGKSQNNYDFRPTTVEGPFNVPEGIGTFEMALFRAGVPFTQGSRLSGHFLRYIKNDPLDTGNKFETNH